MKPKNVSFQSVVEIGCSLRMPLVGLNLNLSGGFSQSRFVALDSFTEGDSERPNGARR